MQFPIAASPKDLERCLEFKELVKEFASISEQAAEPVLLPVCIQKCFKVCLKGDKRATCCWKIDHIWCENRQLEHVLTATYNDAK